MRTRDRRSLNYREHNGLGTCMTTQFDFTGKEKTMTVDERLDYLDAKAQGLADVDNQRYKDNRFDKYAYLCGMLQQELRHVWSDRDQALARLAEIERINDE